MAKRTNDRSGFAIKVVHNDGISGYLTGSSGDVMTFPKQIDAEKFLKELQATNHYSWNVKSVSVVNFGEEDSS